MSYIVKAVENLYNNSVSVCTASDRGLKFIEYVLSHLTPDAQSIEDLRMAYASAIDDSRRDGGRSYSWGQMAVVRIVHGMTSEC
jgi:hypothetical protein